MSTNGHLKFQGTNRATFVGETSNIMFDTTTTSLGIGVTGTDHPSSNLYITGNAYVSSNIAVGGVLTMGTVNVVARHDLESVTATGNTTPLTVEFQNADTSLVTTGNVEVGKELTVTGNTTVSSNLTVSGNVEVGTANLFVDTVNSRVGIGTTTPLVTLDTHGTMRSSAPYPRFDFYTTTNRSTNAWGNSTDNAGDYRIYSNGDASDGTRRSLNFDYGQNSTHTTRMVINANGNVGIGTTSAIAALDIDGGPEDDTVPALSIRGGQYSESDLYVLNSYNNSTAGGVGYAAKVIGVNIKNKLETDNKIQIRSNTGGLTCGSAMYLGSDDAISGVFGVLTGDGVAGTTLTEKFTVRVNGNVGINKTNPGYILDVHSDDAIHIEQAGNTTFETKVHGGSLFIRNPSASSGYEHFIINNHTASNTTHTTSYIQFRRGDSGNGNPIGTISGNGSTISYGGQSDYRVKENIVPMPISGLDTINNLQPKRFNFIGHPDNIYDGFIAHELQEHIPMAVTGVKDEMRGRGNVVKIDDESIIVKEDVSEPDSLEEGTKWVKLSEEPVYQNVDLSKIVTYLVKAVQELSEENQTLKTRLDALENAS